MKTLDHEMAPSEPQKDPNEEVRKLAEELGSVGDIDNATGHVLFKSMADANSFKAFCDERKLRVRVVEQLGEKNRDNRFRIEPETPPVSEAEPRASLEQTEPEPQPASYRRVERSAEPYVRQFERVLKDKFDRVPRGNFPTALTPFESVTLIPFPSSVSATFYYRTERGIKTSKTWTILKDGTVSGSIPKELTVTREDIGKELMRLLEEIDIKFWHKVDVPIVLESEPGEPRERPIEEGKKEEPLTDMERLAVLRVLGRDTHFGFYLVNSGFKGFHGILVHGARQSLFVVDNPKIGNAQYIIPTSKLISTSPQPDDTEVEAVVARELKPIIEYAGTRLGLVAKAHSARIVHSGAWRERLLETVERLAN